MGTEGAGELSTAAIEAVLDALLDDEPSGAWQYEAAARAELAALQAAATETSALRAALGLARDTFTALRRGVQDELWPGRALSAEDGLALFRLLDEAARGVEEALAHGGPGAAGARDETAALGRVERAARAVRHVTFYGDTGEVGFWGGDRFANRDALAELSAALVALDALRAGGAGTGGGGDG